MICTECGHDDFNVIKVFRNRRQSKGTFKVNDDIDSRIVICKLCGTRFVTETEIKAKIFNREYKLVIKDDQGEFNFNEFIESSHQEKED